MSDVRIIFFFFSETTLPIKVLVFFDVEVVFKDDVDGVVPEISDLGELFDVTSTNYFFKGEHTTICLQCKHSQSGFVEDI